MLLKNTCPGGESSWKDRHEIIICNRISGRDRLNNSEVSIFSGSTLVAKKDIGEASNVMEFEYDDAIGDAVMVQLKGTDFLNIAEVEVIGYYHQ